MRTSLVAVLLVAAAAGAAGAQTLQEQAPRPPPLPPEPGCELWRGTMSGNDPSVQVDVRLCPEGARVRGLLQWSSTRSGWNRRAFDGAWDAARTHLDGRDTAVVEERPQPGWRFCTVDRYALALASPGRLEGTADSAACQDHVVVHLELVGTEPAGGGALPSVPPPLPPATPPPPASVGCASPCATAPGASPAGARAPLALVALVALALSRPRGARPPSSRDRRSRPRCRARR